MPIPNIFLERLNSPANEQLRWLMGDLLVQRSTQVNWFECPIFQSLRKREDALHGLNRLIQSARTVLEDEGEAQNRANSVLNPSEKDFDSKLEDFLAEISAVVRLSEREFIRFRFCDPPQPDLSAERNGRQVFIEVKNLRVPNSLFEIAFSQWEANRTRDTERFQFNVRLACGGIDPILNGNQERKLRNVIDTLPQLNRPCETTETLPGSVAITFKLLDGDGGMVSDVIGGNIADIVPRVEQDLVRKLLLGPLGKALSQLYNAAVPPDAERVIALRWRVYAEAELVETDVRDNVQNKIQSFLAQFFDNIEVHIINLAARPPG